MDNVWYKQEEIGGEYLYRGWQGPSGEPGTRRSAGRTGRACSRCCAALHDEWSRTEPTHGTAVRQKQDFVRYFTHVLIIKHWPALTQKHWHVCYHATQKWEQRVWMQRSDADSGGQQTSTPKTHQLLSKLIFLLPLIKSQQAEMKRLSVTRAFEQHKTNLSTWTSPQLCLQWK